MRRSIRFVVSRVFLTCILLSACRHLHAQDQPSAADAEAAMKKAARYFHSKVAVHGGYVYYYSLDLKQRLGEGKAAPQEIWVQPPGTPTVGMAFLDAWDATDDQFFLNAARDAANALVDGQLESGGWQASIDFDPAGKNTGNYRSGKGRRKGTNNSSLDDDKTQAALRLLMRVDKALQFQDERIHECVQFALESLLKAQFANGGFPQVWKAPVSEQPVVLAQFPNYDWRTEGRIKEYWNYYTLNDGLAGTVCETLWQAWETYHDQRYRDAVIRLGDFLILAQLPEPQPAWAQQYNYEMQPMWARKFEPAAVTGLESQDAIATLLTISEKTGEDRFLKPIPAALEWMKRSELPDGRLARFYELQTNRPLYMVRDVYELTYDDSRLPTHYGFKVGNARERLTAELERIRDGRPKPESSPNLRSLARSAGSVISQMDDMGRWITTADGKPLVGQPKLKPDEQFLSSKVFCQNLQRLSRYIAAARKSKDN
ncbi:MAG: pectic acid lyase [Planctomycetaceae bacterium]|nr:pectic acid lyase [Planctomycetaceae bacterium]